MNKSNPQNDGETRANTAPLIDLDMSDRRLKYLTIYPNLVLVKIERGTDIFKRRFFIRKYDSLNDAIDAALIWRDKTHLEQYGYPVSKAIIQMKKKAVEDKLNPLTGEILPHLPSGLSYGFSRGRLLYVVVSYQDKGRPKKKRFAIKNKSINEVINEAAKYRLDKFQENDRL